MKNDSTGHHYFKWGLTAFSVIAASILVYYIIFHAANFQSMIKQLILILMPIIDGLILAYLLTPIVNFLEKNIFMVILYHFGKTISHTMRKVIRTLSIIMTLMILFLAIYGFFAMAIPQIINSIQTILTQFPKYVDNLVMLVSSVLEEYPDIENMAIDLLNTYSEEIENFVNDTIMPQMNSLIVILSSSVVSFLKSAWNLVIGFIISIYVLASKEKFSAQFKKIFYAILPIETANRFINNIRFTHKTMGGYFIGKILDSIIIGILCFVGANILDLPFMVLISVIVGITNIIPFFGPFLGAIPSTLLILMVNPIKAIYFIIFILILQQLDGNIIGPKILGNSTGLSSFWVIFSITLFGGIFGIFGMVIGVPVFAVLFAAVKSFVESGLRDKELPLQTEMYLKLLYITPEKEVIEFNEIDAQSPAKKTLRIRIKRDYFEKERKDFDKNDKPDK